MLKLKALTFNPFQENTYIIFDDQSKQAIVIDPGMYTAAEQNLFTETVESLSLTVSAIWLTHSHIDHVLGLDFVIDRYRCPYFQTQEDQANLRSVASYAGPMYGIPNFRVPDEAPQFLMDNQELDLAGNKFQVLYTPGHARGHVAFYNVDLGVIAGDALFNGSIGRTDLPGGDFSILEKSIKTRLYVLSEETIVFPGHGPETTINQEKRFNPFVRV